jgi:G:T/U-mismatch repair DNA glycosylase
MAPNVLPDYLARGLRLVICGTAVALRSAGIGHYYAGPGNEFWQLLWGSRIVGEPLSPLSDSRDRPVFVLKRKRGESRHSTARGQGFAAGVVLGTEAVAALGRRVMLDQTIVNR